MAVWPFNRKEKNNGQVPPEVKRYYESEHRERVGLAWLVAFLSLLATILIVAGLFFGGRWIYRKITNNDNPPSTSQSSDANKSESSNSNNQADTNKSQSETNGNNQSDSSNAEPNSNSSSNQPANNNSAEEPTPSPSSGQATPNQVADTGPGSTLGVFLAVTALTYLGHAAYLRRKQQA